jgi:NADH-quinone oxidoreductase subunit C
MSEVVRSPAVAAPVEGGVVHAGWAAPDAPPPATPRGVPHRGGAENPTAAALRGAFGEAIVRTSVTWGETTVVVARARYLDIMRWLHAEPAERYDSCVDVTGVEFRDPGAPLELVVHLRSLPHRRFLRVKVELAKRQAELWVPSITPIWSGAEWLERECYDMFGIRFEGHPDLRRILMWDSYAEGHPLRKDFPLRGRFSRAEQLSRALAKAPEAHYSINELSVAEAFDDLPEDMRQRLAARRGPVGE